MKMCFSLLSKGRSSRILCSHRSVDLSCKRICSTNTKGIIRIYLYMVVCHTTDILLLTQRHNDTAMEVNDGDALGNHYHELGRELGILGDALNERGHAQRRDYEEIMRLSCFASVGLATGLALFVTFQFIRRRYVRNQ